MIKDFGETIKNKAKENKGDFSLLLGPWGAGLLRNLLTGNRAKRSKIPTQGVMRPGEGAIRIDQDYECRLIL